MSLNKPISNRKAASSFINDDTETDLIQLSPVKRLSHFEQNNNNTMATNQGSRTNFIGNSILPTERHRAFAVTKTGEKQLLDLDDNFKAKNTSNPFVINSPRFSAPTMERISEKSSSQQSIGEKSSKSNSKLVNNPLKCHKYRVSYTPRNVKAASAGQLLVSNPKREKINSKVPTNTSTETQTEYNSSLSCCSYIPKYYNKSTAATANYIPLEGPNNFYKEPTMLSQQRFYNTATPPPVEPLRIYTKTNYNLRKYSELRSLASALTLIIVVSWLLSTYFDVESLWDYLDNLWQYFRSWFLPKEKPKTKMEIFITFLQDLWS